jgi:hypothetical protein
MSETRRNGWNMDARNRTNPVRRRRRRIQPCRYVWREREADVQPQRETLGRSETACESQDRSRRHRSRNTRIGRSRCQRHVIRCFSPLHLQRGILQDGVRELSVIVFRSAHQPPEPGPLPARVHFRLRGSCRVVFCQGTMAIDASSTGKSERQSDLDLHTSRRLVRGRHTDPGTARQRA